MVDAQSSAVVEDVVLLDASETVSSISVEVLVVLMEDVDMQAVKVTLRTKTVMNRRPHQLVQCS